MGAGSGRREGWEAGAGRNGNIFATLAQYFEIANAHRGGNHYGRGRDSGVQGARGRSSDPTAPPPPQPVIFINCIGYLAGSVALFPLLKVLKSTVINLYLISSLKGTTKATTEKFETEHPKTKRYQNRIFNR